jgi:hypothetical protein
MELRCETGVYDRKEALAENWVSLSAAVIQVKVEYV